MQKLVLVLTTSAFILASGTITARTQQSPGGLIMPRPAQPPTTQQPTNPQAPGMMGQSGLMGPGMMGQSGVMGPGMMGQGDMTVGGMMGHGMMGRGMMMRVMFSLMDGDGDGTISLQEFQAAHERIFRAMDANKDGRLTPEEMRAFVLGTSPTQQ